MAQYKAQRVGGHSLYIVLPKDWVKEQGVTAGDAVDVTTTNSGELLVSFKRCSCDQA